MQKLLTGKTAVITGCRKGIGKKTLETFAKNGANIFACVRAEDESFSEFISVLGKENNITITPVYFDFADSAQVTEGAKTIMTSKLPVDILVNNAGMIQVAPFQMTSISKMKEVFDINFFHQIAFTQYIARIMTKQKCGSIVNISSSAAVEGNEGRLAYASAKAAVQTATKVMSRELAAHNIRVNCIAPGLTQTDMMTDSTPEVALKETIERISMKRVGEPQEIANVILFLASDLSSYMTGQLLRVDGGM
jgi:3-oxoacyl-[acyl-carrier protein] reductase